MKSSVYAWILIVLMYATPLINAGILYLHMYAIERLVTCSVYHEYVVVCEDSSCPLVLGTNVCGKNCASGLDCSISCKENTDCQCKCSPSGNIS